VTNASGRPPIRIAVIGGAGARTPLLVGGLTRSDLPIERIVLYDIDQERLRLIEAVATRACPAARLCTCRTSAEAIEGADYVFLSIRVGGIRQRARDEAVALAHGVVGQETIGPGGFAMAFRTIPHVLQYAAEVERLWGQMRPLYEALRSAGVRIALAGHWHRNNVSVDDGFEMIASGPVGYPLGSDPSGFRMVDVFADRVTHEYIPLPE